MKKGQMTKQVYSAPGIRTVALRSAKMIAGSGGNVGGSNSNIGNDDNGQETDDGFGF